MKFHKRMQEIEEKLNSRFKKAPEGNYIFQVQSVVDGKSKTGNPMLTLELDIAKGEYANTFAMYPLKYYATYGNDDQLSRLKTTLKSFQKSNPSYITDKDLEADKFDEKKLKSLLIGGMIKYEDYTNKNGEVKSGAKVAWLFSTDRVKVTESDEEHLINDKEVDAILNSCIVNNDKDDLPF